MFKNKYFKLEADMRSSAAQTLCVRPAETNESLVKMTVDILSSEAAALGCFTL